MRSKPIFIHIGRTVIELKCSHPTIVGQLQLVYKEFIGKGPAHFRVDIEIQPWTGQTSDPGDRTSIADSLVVDKGAILFNAPGIMGVIGKRQASLRLCSPYPVGDIDYFIRVVCADLAYEQGGMLLHSAAIRRRGVGFLFFGPSGIGKTTVARLSTDDVVLNDDLVLLTPPEAPDTPWKAHATPFSNPTQVRPTPIEAPVFKLFRLFQDKQVYVERMNLGQATAELLSCVPILPADPSRCAELIERCLHLAKAVPVSRLHFLPDASFWQAAESGL